MERHRPFARLVAPIVIAALAAEAACGDDKSPTAPEPTPITSTRQELETALTREQYLELAKRNNAGIVFLTLAAVEPNLPAIELIRVDGPNLPANERSFRGQKVRDEGELNPNTLAFITTSCEGMYALTYPLGNGLTSVIPVLDRTGNISFDIRFTANRCELSLDFLVDKR